MSQEKFANPYIIGVLLGLLLLSAYYTMGRGLGSSSAFARLTAVGAEAVAPGHARENAYLKKYFRPDKAVLDDFLVFLALGAALGGFLSAAMARRIKFQIERGPNATAQARLGLAFAGGMLTGFGARLARGCNSGQLLVGDSQLAVGSWVATIAFFAAGLAAAHLLSKEWN
jgi:hypothetical protein